MQRRRTTSAVPALVTLLASGMGPALGAGDHDGGHGHGGDHGHEELAFGEPVSRGEADRTVRVRAYDSMSFDPSPVTVEAGETVRFVVENAGEIQHSFTLGTPAYQHRHEEEMQGMPAEALAGHMDDVPNGVVVAPGDSGTLTWTFERGGPVQFACHVPGHYRAGMKGTVRVQ